MRLLEMDKLLLILPQFFVTDIITNSSSELFICKTDTTVEIVTEILQEMVVYYNKLFETNYDFLGMFGDIIVANQENLKELVCWFRSYHNEPRQWAKETWEDYWKRLDKWRDQQEEEWIKNESGKYVGRVLIYSADDNSIPWELFELIERKFNATRVHLG